MNICVMGNSGSGKTTCFRNMPPKETFFIDADGKGLPWRGWRKDYNSQNMNYMATSDKNRIMQTLEMINLKQRVTYGKNQFGEVVPDYSDKTPMFESIRYVVIDTLNGIMVDDEMSRMKEKNYDKWVDLATAVYGIIAYTLHMRPEITVIFTAHVQEERDENTGEVTARIKTNGKKLDKIVLESKFNTVLYSKVKDGRYVFETHANNSTAKTPLGAFEENEIDNDIMKVLEVLEDYR